MNYHSGALHALQEEGGVDVSAADLVVGTSAGSVVGALLRSGWSARDCFDYATGTHPSTLAGGGDGDDRPSRQSSFVPGFTSPLDLARRSVGSAYVVARSVLRTPSMPVPAFLARPVNRALAKGFPAGVFTMGQARRQLGELLPESWPQRDLWLVAVDLGSGRRVVLGRPGAPETPLVDGVLASCAIPGVYPPVRTGRLTLVDGGAHSTTNLDLAAKAGCDVVVTVAPMAFDSVERPALARQLARRPSSRSLQAEARRARADGAAVLLVRPTAPELALHGGRLMRSTDGPAIAQAAYDATAHLLQTPRAQEVLERLRAS